MRKVSPPDGAAQGRRRREVRQGEVGLQGAESPEGEAGQLSWAAGWEPL